MRRLIILATLALALTACGGGSPATPAAPRTHTITGLVDLEVGSTRNGSTCTGAGGFSDLKEGAQVLILNEDGTTIATGSLASGTFQPARGVLCTWSFTIADVPDAKFYKAKINHRDGPSYSYADLEQRGWKIELRL